VNPPVRQPLAVKQQSELILPGIWKHALVDSKQDLHLHEPIRKTHPLSLPVNFLIGFQPGHDQLYFTLTLGIRKNCENGKRPGQERERPSFDTRETANQRNLSGTLLDDNLIAQRQAEDDRKGNHATVSSILTNGALWTEAYPIRGKCQAAYLPRLKEIDRETLVPFYIRGRSLKQMSRDFETPVGTIKRRLHVARNRLRRQLERARANPAAPMPRRTGRRAELAAV